jgi:DNA-binding NarL/FixJ family response regulator
MLGNYVIVALADNGREAVRLACQLMPDIVLMDLKMPDFDGIEATRQIFARVKGIKILLLSGYANPELLLQAQQVGASGYILKCTPILVIARAIDTIHAGHTFFGSGMDHLKTDTASDPPTDDRALLLKTLTDCEDRVFDLLGEGREVHEIAVQLSIIESTVNTHRASIKVKLKFTHNSELVHYATLVVNSRRE